MMSKQTKTILITVFFIVLMVGAYFAYNALSDKYESEVNQLPSQASSTPEVSQKMLAPDFKVLDSNQKEVKLSDLKGKPIVLNFWASWCPPCKSEMPHFNEVYEQYKEEVQFMMVDLVDGQRETVEKGQGYVTKQGFTFPIYFDTKQEAAYIYQVSSIPTTLFIDKDGYVVTGYEGAISKAKLINGIEAITD